MLIGGGEDGGGSGGEDGACLEGPSWAIRTLPEN